MNGVGLHPIRAIRASAPIHPWIQQKNPRRFKIGSISGHNVQAMPPGRGGDQAISGWHGSSGSLGGGCKLAPDAACFQIDRKQPVSIVALQRLQPDL